MLLKERLFLSNCDSVRTLTNDELRKRILIGLTFGEGVILSPNMLLENPAIIDVLRQRNVVKFLNEEGLGSLTVRGLNVQALSSMSDYFDRLPGHFRISSLAGIQKQDLTPEQLDALRVYLRRLDAALIEVQPSFENAQIVEDSLSSEIQRRLSPGYFAHTDAYERFVENGRGLQSRSEWYRYLDEMFASDASVKEAIRNEIVDPSYNSLFIHPEEGFFQDNIKVLEKVPEIILDSGVVFKSLRREIELIEYPIKAFEWITSWGTTDLLKMVTEKAADYIEDKLVDKGMSHMSRKNWYGLYPVLTRKIGLEIK